MKREEHVDELVAVYTLGALDPDEKVGVERHLASCARCRGLVDEMRSIVSILPRGVEPVEPSPQLKKRLFARVDADLAAERVRAREASEAREGGWQRVAGLLGRLSPALVLGMLLVVVVLGGRLYSLQQELAQIKAELAFVSRSGLQVATLPPAEAAPAGAQAQLFLNPGAETALLAVSGLSPLDSSKSYEFWLIRDGKPVPAGLFSVDPNGTGRLLISAAEPIGSFEMAGITIEPAGGSEVPTMEALVFAGPIQ